ncbi:hypothetical protein [Bradyrhizobium sp. McL0616]
MQALYILWDAFFGFVALPVWLIGRERPTGGIDFNVQDNLLQVRYDRS